MKKTHKLIAMIAIGISVAMTAGVSAHAADGEKVYKKCKACHKFGKNSVGPDLTGIVGRQVGTVNFKFSKAFKAKSEEGLMWTEENLDAFLKKPRSFIKKTKMAFAGLKKEEDRKAVIEYLKTK